MVSGKDSTGSSVPRAHTEELMPNPGPCVPAHAPHPCSASPGPPGIQDSQRETLDADMGTPLVLTCQVTGVPMPTVTWLKDGSPLGMCSGEAVTGCHPEHHCCPASVSASVRELQGPTGQEAEHEGAGPFPVWF